MIIQTVFTESTLEVYAVKLFKGINPNGVKVDKIQIFLKFIKFILQISVSIGAFTCFHCLDYVFSTCKNQYFSVFHRCSKTSIFACVF